MTNKFTQNIVSGNLSVSLSDHIPQFAMIPLRNKNFLPKDHNILVRDYKKLNITNLKNELNTLNLNFSNETDVHKDTLVFNKQVNKIINKHAPLRKITNKENKLKSKPWLTKGILKSIKVRDIIFHRLVKEKNQANNSRIFSKYKCKLRLPAFINIYVSLFGRL